MNDDPTRRDDPIGAPSDGPGDGPGDGPSDEAARLARQWARERAPEATGLGPPPREGVHGARLPTRHLRVEGVDGATIRFAARSGPARAALTFADHDLLRLEVHPTGTPAQARTWTVVGEGGDVPYEGRDRDDLTRFPRPAIHAGEGDGDGVILDARDADLDPSEGRPHVTLRSAALEVRVDLAPFALTIHRADGTLVWRDLPTGAHGHLPGRGVRWHWRRDDDEVLYGLGEAAGPLDRARRRFRLRPLDALAYDAETGDPLYKHLPVLTTLAPDGRASSWLVDSGAVILADLGAEVDNYHGPYRHLEVMEESLDAWFLAGPHLGDVAHRLADLTGTPPVPPRWTLGYLASTMHYTDAEDPVAAFRGFVADLERHEIHAAALHLSSGYSLHDDGLRYVFHWNDRRVPDPTALLDVLNDAGIRSIANLKPALLTTHPEFDDLAARGLLVRNAAALGTRRRDGIALDDDDDVDPDGPYLSRFWGGEGGYLDFGHPEAVAWWKARVKERILEVGTTIAWNDNNEYQIWDPGARSALGPTRGLRPVLATLMNKASFEAQAEHAPDARPWTLTRSGMPGTWRYAQTWTGDNHTDWHTLRYNVPQGLNLSLSGWVSYGHDVGGFAGPMPDADLLVRWIEHGVTMPRFTIHSWNEDGSVTEPWSHPEVLPRVRRLLALRDRLVGYLATAFRAAATDGTPLVRPLAYAFPAWRPGHREDLVHLLGPALLVAPVVEPGVTERPVRLPPGRWWELATGRVHAGDGVDGSDGWVTAAAPLGTPAWFLRAGVALPLVGPDGREALVRGGAGWPEGSRVDWWGLPDDDGRLTGHLMWDDGVSRAHERGVVDRYTLSVAAPDGAPNGGPGAAPRAEVRAQVRTDLGVPPMRLLTPPATPASEPPAAGRPTVDPDRPWWDRDDAATAVPLEVVRTGD